MKSSLRIYRKYLQRELISLLRQPRQLVYSLLFFVIVVLLFPLTLPPEPKILQNVAPALLWMALLLAVLRSSENFLQSEYRDGVLEQWIISQQPLLMILQAKLLVHWCLAVIPLLVLSPLLLLFYYYPLDALFYLISGILLGSPALLSLCALASTFGMGLQQRGVMMALIVFPLVIPVMILGSGLPEAVSAGQSAQALLALILAISILAVTFLPFAMASTIRAGLME